MFVDQLQQIRDLSHSKQRGVSYTMVSIFAETQDIDQMDVFQKCSGKRHCTYDGEAAYGLWRHSHSLLPGENEGEPVVAIDTTDDRIL